MKEPNYTSTDFYIRIENLNHHDIVVTTDDSQMVVNGTMMYRHEDYLTAIDQVSSGAIRLEPLISNHFPFEQYDEAYKFIDENSATSMKIIIKL